MTLRDTVQIIEDIASQEPAVALIVRNDIFRLNTKPDAMYGVFAWTQQQHSVPMSGDLMRFAFTLYYVDRLTEDKGNELEIQSTAVQVLTNILRALPAADVFPYNVPTIRTFNQRFSDECAGAFANVTLEVRADTVCAYDYTATNTQII
ncbi:MAG: hypothetical protein K6A62_04725 [Bacteroidales bacterium]|nr:hypothetical protein [Bacteroidales bacterium]